MATWPGTLPTQMQQDGFREGQPPDAAIRSQPSSGPAKQRNRYSALKG